jgi:hypothetical protein
MRPTSIAALAASLALPLLLGASSPSGCGGGSPQVASDTAAHRNAGDGAFAARARLEGFQETPAISTTGHGSFSAKLSPDQKSIDFELSYADLAGTANGGQVLAAHIHLGQRGVAGGISVPLCGGAKPACPTPSGSVTGTLTASDVTGPAAQGIGAGQLDKLVAAMRAGVTYANVHTTQFASGEIRGQLGPARGDADEGDEHGEK